MKTYNPANDKNLPFPDRRLLDAISSGNEDAVEKALAGGAKANGFANDGGPLLEAGRKENIHIAALLHAAGADIAKTEKLSKDKHREIADRVRDGTGRGNEWAEISSYQSAVDWLREHRQEIALLGIGITGRQLLQRVGNLEQRFTALEEKVDKVLNPAALEKSKLTAPKTP